MKKRSDRESFDSKLRADLRQLSETGVEPERDLWPDLARKIVAPPPKRQAQALLRLVAAFVLVTGLAAAIWWWTQPHEMSPVPVSQRSLSDLPPSSSQQLRESFEAYLERRKQLLELVARELDSYPLAVRSEIGDSIAVIEEAMREIESSMAHLPSEPVAEMRLADLYDLELRLLEVVSARLQGAPGGMER